eukprot:jgi/Chlat1/607/Chrsp103S00957
MASTVASASLRTALSASTLTAQGRTVDRLHQRQQLASEPLIAVVPRRKASMENGKKEKKTTEAIAVGASSGRNRWTFEQRHSARRTIQPKKETEIFVMLPMDIISVGELKEGDEVSFINSPSLNAKLLDKRFSALKKAGAEGVMMDVWWGICERHGPKKYDFAAYMQLFKKAQKHGLKVQAVMSFHAGGGNVGDGSTDIPLPPWVLAAGEELGDEVFYTDKKGGRDHECLSLGCDHEPVLAGRTPIEVYVDFVKEFKAQCEAKDLWGSVVKEICMGTGPCGELRFPAYQEKGAKWSYFGETVGVPGNLTIQRGIPGIGEFQCYDKFMLADLKEEAEKHGVPEWAEPPREAAGSYDFAPWETEFFALTSGAGFLTEYGKFFMEWYSGVLVRHAEDILDALLPAIGHPGKAGSKSEVDVAVKVAGIHWWYKSRSHAAEMTAGYYNYLEHDGYLPLAEAFAKRGVGLSFTCIEMSDTENPDLRHCSPEDLVKQVIAAGKRAGCQILAENALEGGLYNPEALNRMLDSSQHFDRITLLRLANQMFEYDSSQPEGFSVREPLASFLSKFKKEAPAEPCEPLTAPAASAPPPTAAQALTTA